MDFLVEVGGDALEEVSEVGEGIEVVAFGAGDEAEVDGGGVSAPVGAEEEPVFASECDGADCLFGGVVVDGEVAVGRVSVERVPVAERVVGGLADGAFGQHVALAGDEAFFEGVEEGLGFVLFWRKLRRAVASRVLVSRSMS